MSPAAEPGVTLKARVVAVLDLTRKQWGDALALARSCPGEPVELAQGRLELLVEPDGRVLVSAHDLTVEVKP